MYKTQIDLPSILQTFSGCLSSLETNSQTIYTAPFNKFLLELSDSPQQLNILLNQIQKQQLNEYSSLRNYSETNNENTILLVCYLIDFMGLSIIARPLMQNFFQQIMVNQQLQNKKNVAILVQLGFQKCEFLLDASDELKNLNYIKLIHELPECRSIMTKQSSLDKFYISMIIAYQDILQQFDVLSDDEYILKSQIASKAFTFQNKQKLELQSNISKNSLDKKQLFHLLKNKINEVQHYMNEQQLRRLDIELLMLLNRRLQKLHQQLWSVSNLDEFQDSQIPFPNMTPNEQELEKQPNKYQKLGQRCMFLLGEKIKQTENQMFEFKNLTFPVKNSKYKDIITSVICSLLNTKGGYLIFGIDDRTLEVVGMSLKLHQRDQFKLQLIDLALSIYPNPDLREQHEVAVTFIPIKNKSNHVIPDLFIVQVTVQQGQYLEKVYTYKALSDNQTVADFRLDGRKQSLRHPELIEEIYKYIQTPKKLSPKIESIDQEQIQNIEDIKGENEGMGGLCSSIRLSTQRFTINFNLRPFLISQQIVDFQQQLTQMLNIEISSIQKNNKKNDHISIQCNSLDIFDQIKGEIVCKQAELNRNSFIMNIFANKDILIDYTKQQKIFKVNPLQEIFQDACGYQKKQWNFQMKDIEFNPPLTGIQQQADNQKVQDNLGIQKLLKDLEPNFPSSNEQNSQQQAQTYIQQKQAKQQKQKQHQDQGLQIQQTKAFQTQEKQQKTIGVGFYLIVIGFNFQNRNQFVEKLNLSSKPSQFELDQVTYYRYSMHMSFKTLQGRNNYINLIAQRRTEFLPFNFKNKLSFFYCQEQPALKLSQLCSVQIKMLQAEDFQMQQVGGQETIIFERLSHFLQAHDILTEKFLKDGVSFMIDWNEDFAIGI